MRAVLCQTHDEFDKAGPGAIFLWRFEEKGSHGHVMLKCPGCGRESAMHCRTPGTPHPDVGASWELTGLLDKPSMHPSINCVGCCGWHGYLKNGEYSTA